MRTMLYKVGSTLLKAWSGNRIKGKTYAGTQKQLFYEQGQHLHFFFQKEIKYEPEIFEIIKPYINNKNIVFDIGSNIGQYALPLSEWIGSKGKLCCYEPNSRNHAFLALNKHINACENIILNKKGLADQEGEATFYLDSTTGGRRSSLIKDYVGDTFTGREEKIQLTTLDAEIEKYGKPHFIKIDAEGFEIKILEGCQKNLPNTVWLIEVRGETIEAVTNYFKDSHSCLLITEKGTRVLKDNKMEGLNNLLFKPTNL